MERFPPALRVIAQAFDNADSNVRLVGGAVRDIVMGKQPKDWDMATPALPEQTMKLLETIGKPFDLSNGHGTISIILDGETYEITTLRVDAETDGRHAKVEFVTDYEQDAARRDFTMNAMSMDIITGEVFDYFGGKMDIANRIVRFVGNPDQRIQEDYLRILRFFRFAARYNWHMDVQALFACERNAAGLNQISGERIWMEVKQIMATENADTFVKYMRDTGVWEVIINR
jgi:tRNA nucleotidyltransferase/poly(A) polymerase